MSFLKLDGSEIFISIYVIVIMDILTRIFFCILGVDTEMIWRGNHPLIRPISLVSKEYCINNLSLSNWTFLDLMDWCRFPEVNVLMEKRCWKSFSLYYYSLHIALFFIIIDLWSLILEPPVRDKESDVGSISCWFRLQTVIRFAELSVWKIERIWVHTP